MSLAHQVRSHHAYLQEWDGMGNLLFWKGTVDSPQNDLNSLCS
ncbi:MAG TPA: hypothetical protein VK203_01705 [Nostocaceae cyanobacterium]|nr:hypothetical protein [Nostocaceae cyanobacterium]